MDDQSRSIIRNVKGPGTSNPPKKYPCDRESELKTRRRLTSFASTVREDDILCLLESEREARRLR